MKSKAEVKAVVKNLKLHKYYPETETTEVINRIYRPDGTFSETREIINDSKDYYESLQSKVKNIPVIAPFTIFNGSEEFEANTIAYVTPNQAERVVNNGGRILSDRELNELSDQLKLKG